MNSSNLIASLNTVPAALSDEPPNGKLVYSSEVNGVYIQGFEDPITGIIRYYKLSGGHAHEKLFLPPIYTSVPPGVVVDVQPVLRFTTNLIVDAANVAVNIVSLGNASRAGATNIGADHYRTLVIYFFYRETYTPTDKPK